MEEAGRMQEKGKGSGGSQRKQPLGKERGGGKKRKGRGDPPFPEEFLSYIIPRVNKGGRVPNPNMAMP